MFKFLPTLEEIAETDIDQLMTRCVLDAFLKMDMKSQTLMKEAFNENDHIALEDYKVSGFNKTQWKGKLFYNLSFKVGQCIAQHSKTKNMVLKFHCYVVDNILRNFRGKGYLYASGKADAEIQKEIDEILQQCTAMFLKFGENDFTEFDSTQNQLMPLLCLKILQYYSGMQTPLMETYRNQLAARMIDIPGVIKMLVEWMKDSGEVATLLFNTIWNTVWVSFILDIKGIVLGAFKGDDSAIVAEDIKINKTNMELLESCGLKTKLFISESHCSFTDMVLCREGCVLDVCRRGSKVLSKTFKPRDDQAKKQMMESVSDIIGSRVINFAGQIKCERICGQVFGVELSHNFMNALICIAKGKFGSEFYSDKTLNIVFSKNLKEDN